MLKNYIIADFKVSADFSYDLILKRCEKFSTEISFDNPDIFIPSLSERFDIVKKDAPHFSNAECEAFLADNLFAANALKLGALVLHASCVVLDNKAYLFCAKSGGGKSTHTRLWLKSFEGARIINDDKPLIKHTADGFYAYGTPFSGQSEQNLNECAKIAGICFIEKSDTCSCEKLSESDASVLLMQNTIRPPYEKAMTLLFDITQKMVEEIPMYKLICNISDEAVKLAYDTMK